MPNVAFLQSGIRWIWVTVLVIVLDRFTKNFAQAFLSIGDPLSIVPGFNLTLSYNTGAAFSFLDGASGWQVFFFGGIATIASIVFIYWLSRISWRNYSESIALALIVGGALGNLWDRFLYGQVVDFIQLYVSHFYWPTFNIADSAICIGAVLLICHAWFKKDISIHPL